MPTLAQADDPSTGSTHKASAPATVDLSIPEQSDDERVSEIEDLAAARESIAKRPQPGVSLSVSGSVSQQITRSR